MKQVWIEALDRWQGFLEMGWQASLLALGILVVVVLMRKVSAPLRYGLLLVALVKFALPAIPAPVGFFPWLGERLVWPTEGTVAIAPVAANSPSATAPLEVSSATTLMPASTFAFNDLMPTLMGLYVLGLLFFLARIVWQKQLLNVWVRAAQPCEDASVLNLYADVCRRLGMQRPPRLLISDEPATPAAFGLWKPAILLPRALVKGLDAPSLRAVLGHELAHHKRGDLWVHTLQRFLAAIWWFNPFYHGLDRALASTREECCDDLVLSAGIADDRVYCVALLDSADLCLDDSKLRREPRPLVLALSSGFEPLATRLTRIMDRSWHRAARLGSVGALLVAVLAVAVLPGKTVAKTTSADNDLVNRQLLTLNELQIRQAWPRFILERLMSLEANRVETLDFADETFELDLKTPGLLEMTQVTDHFGPSPVKSDLRSVVQTDRGTVGSLLVELEMLPDEGDASSGLASPDSPREERDRLVGTLLVKEDAIQAVLMKLKAVVEGSPVELVTLKPQPRNNRDLFSEWPLDLWISGDAAARMTVLHDIARLSGVVIETLESQGESVTKVGILVLGAPTHPDLDRIEPSNARRYDGSLARLRRVAADLGC